MVVPFRIKPNEHCMSWIDQTDRTKWSNAVRKQWIEAVQDRIIPEPRDHIRVYRIHLAEQALQREEDRRFFEKEARKRIPWTPPEEIWVGTYWNLDDYDSGCCFVFSEEHEEDNQVRYIREDVVRRMEGTEK